MAEWLCVPSGKRLNVGSSPTVGAVFKAMKAEYVVVAEQAHPLGPAYSLLYIWYKCKNIFTKMLKDVGMEVPESIETRSKFSMHAIIPCLCLHEC